MIEKIPEKALCRISRDSKYWLYVNGKSVVFERQLKRGPAPKDTYFDAVDLSRHLKQGKNVIAVLMWYFGKDGFSHKNSSVPGFLFDASTNGNGGLELLSSSDWKAMVYTAYEQKTKDPQPNFRLLASRSNELRRNLNIGPKLESIWLDHTPEVADGRYFFSAVSDYEQATKWETLDWLLAGSG